MDDGRCKDVRCNELFKLENYQNGKRSGIFILL